MEANFNDKKGESGRFFSHTGSQCRAFQPLNCYYSSVVSLFFSWSQKSLTPSCTFRGVECMSLEHDGWGYERQRLKPLTSGKVKYLVSGYCFLHCHGFEHLRSVSHMDVCMAEDSCKYSMMG